MVIAKIEEKKWNQQDISFNVKYPNLSNAVEIRAVYRKVKIKSIFEDIK